MPRLEQAMPQFVDVDTVRPGDRLWADETIICIPRWSCVEIKSDDMGLYFDCKSGKHRLIQGIKLYRTNPR